MKEQMPKTKDSMPQPEALPDMTARKAQPHSHAPVQQKYGEYLFGGSFEDPNAPASDGKPNWNSYPLGRVMIRLFSRGIMGASFYTLGGAIISKQLTGYTNYLPLQELGGLGYPLRYMARFVDRAIGGPIKAYVRAISPAETAAKLVENATTFRDTAHFGYRASSGTGELIAGRSIGHEAVAMTFDFAMGSIGDAWGRRIANMFDPNIDNGWYKDGSFNVRQFGKDVASATWTVLTKNQGEDWAAAIPYIYQMRWQRRMIEKLSPGFVYSSDRSLNGGSWRINEQGNIIGSYAAAGALDLQLRFTGYNWYTLMFRDGYDALGKVIHDWRQGQPPTVTLPHHPVEATLTGAAYLMRYVLKSMMKATIYMTPAVPFFWAFRTPQTKYKGLAYALDAEGKATFVTMPDGRPYTYFDGTLSRNTPLTAAELALGPGGVPLAHGDLGAHFNPYARKMNTGGFDRMVRYGGVASNCFAKGLTKAVESAGLKVDPAHVYNWANASISYTPYMIAKAETALATEGVDEGIYQVIDGVFGLQLGKVKAGLHDIREELMNTARRRGRQVAAEETPKTLLIPVPQQMPAPSEDKHEPEGVRETPSQIPERTLSPGHENRQWQGRSKQEHITIH